LNVEIYYPVAVVTLLCGLMLFGMSYVVGRVHARTGIHAPVMTGDPLLERAIRAHMNTLEWMPIFLPALWLFAAGISPGWAATLGLLWMAARVHFFIGYMRAPKGRVPGFVAQAAIAGILLVAALLRFLWLWLI
jgi:uncharacterized membrane protein YecN with MAPEG domain